MRTIKWQSKAKIRVLWFAVKQRFLRSELGFTLIELSIVLVIIGLIAGGILLGKALIEAADVRYAASQLTQLETSYRNFQLKYNCIIGDCPNATSLFGANYYTYSPGCTYTNGAGNGDGNGIIDGGGGWWGCESFNAAASLAVSQMLPSSIYNAKGEELYINNNMYFKWIDGAYGYFYNDDLYQPSGMPMLHENTVTFFKNLPSWPTGAAMNPVKAQAIDTKIDDGLAEKGKFSGVQAATDAVPNTLIPTSCSNGSVYNTNEDATCRVLYYFK